MLLKMMKYAKSLKSIKSYIYTTAKECVLFSVEKVVWKIIFIVTTIHFTHISFTQTIFHKSQDVFPE